MSSKKRSATTDSREGSYPSSSKNKSTSKQPATKKTRFVDPDDDPANFAEQVDSALEGPTRKRAVKTEGYDTDSTDDGEGVVFSRRRDGGEVDEDEDDMFAVAEKAPTAKSGDGLGDTGEGRRREEKYMRLGDIEGQEFGGEKSGDEDEDDEDDQEPEDEDDAARRSKAGMGYELSSFNMREEMEEGKFTADGTYVRSYDPHGAHDRWMEGLSDKEIKLARKRKKQQEKIQRQKIAEEEQELRNSGGKEEMEKKLLPLLKKGETVLEALQRLGTYAKKRHGKAKHAAPIDAPSNTELAPTNIELITHLASNLMSLGDTDVYSRTYEEMVRDIRRSGAVDANWDPPSADLKYEYRWDMPGADHSQVFGPFSEDEMRSWLKASYFGPLGENVKVRAVGGEWSDWDDVLA